MNSIVLIGFMGSGKSTVGKILSERLNMGFIDTDALVEEKSGIEIKTIFELYGEEYFRNIESETLMQLSALENMIIATGGGIVKREENIPALKAAGVVVYLAVSIDEICSRLSQEEIEKRPLLKNAATNTDVKNIFDQRTVLYQNAADIIIAIKGDSPEQIAEKIITQLNN